jgi:ferredoxin-NADP reductase/predicted pyridoxine 5'-phosphate oxidase superfamily flavin-nucleotide-binding protein
MNEQSPFHSGELTVQALANEADIAQRNGTVVSKHIIKGALSFIGQQSMTVVSSTDENNQIWTSVLFGEPGFIKAQDDQHILIDRKKIIQQPNDPLWRNIEHNSQVGLVIIELSTRRRLRVNGNISLLSNGQYEVTVAQAYPNCPKYIQRRQPNLSAGVLTYNAPMPKFGSELTSEQLTLITDSDSFFVGSGVTDHHNDASYRGGDPGFVSIVNNRQLLIPDYKGNSMFNTLGNFESNEHTGLVFIDFESNKLLQLTGTAKVLWDQVDDANITGGTKRYWHFNVTRWQETALPPALNWTFFEYSPHNPKPLVSEELLLVVSDITQKSDRIKALKLTAKDGGILPAFEPGSHLPVEIELSTKNTALRHYSITSSSHDNRFYEIAVQQEKHGSGGSNYMHEQLSLGQIINAKSPVNAFSLSSPGKHHILIAGGIGITPILSMLRHLSQKNESYELHYSVKTDNDLAFKAEIVKLAGNNAHFYVTKGKSTEGNSTHKSLPTRLDINSLFNERNKSSHVYVCGPIKMIEAVKDTADENNWQANRIHFESFGSSAQETDQAVEVKLKKSGKVIVIDPKQTLLDGLLAANINVPFECKRGECGMCVTEYVEGTPDHRDIYLTKDEKAHSLCLCVSRAKSKSITLNL